MLAVIREYRAASSDGEKRLDAINRLISTAKAGEIDLLRVCEFEAVRCSPEQKVALAEIVARILFQGTEPPEDDEVIKFEQFAKELGGEVLAKIVKKHLQKDLAQKWLRIIEPHHRAPLYNAWAEIIRLEDPDAVRLVGGPRQ